MGKSRRCRAGKGGERKEGFPLRRERVAAKEEGP